MAITKDKAEIIAAAYIKAGCNKEAGMKAANYADSSLKSGKVKRVVYHNILVLQAIDRITAKNRAKVEYNYTQAMLEIDQLIASLREQAKSGNIQAKSLLLAAIKEKNCISGLQKQTVKHEETRTPVLSPAETKALADVAKDYKLKIAN